MARRVSRVSLVLKALPPVAKVPPGKPLAPGPIVVVWFPNVNVLVIEIVLEDVPGPPKLSLASGSA
jgi:hypothetical protein